MPLADRWICTPVAEKLLAHILHFSVDYFLTTTKSLLGFGFGPIKKRGAF